ncbi:MAG: glycosyltransferase [Marinoscillum sp.]|uniref:glycosyltransferase n=1 Tax=Marinoscillum sp. TaxID=2024838 RepID=UPI0032F40B8B
MSKKATQIPNHFHFIWMGPKEPFFLIVAIQSVLLRCKGAKVTLWVDQDNNPSPEIDTLKKNKHFSIRKIDLRHFVDQIEDETVKKVITDNFDIVGVKSNTAKKQPTKPVERSRSNLLRYLILYLHGGVYLDADTIVLKDLKPLLDANSGFIGKENAAWPIAKREQLFHRIFWGPILEIVRFIAIQLPFGYRLNPLYAFLSSASENNAVLGFTAKHNYLFECFDYISKMDKNEIIKSLRLGPFLLQRVSRTYVKGDLNTYAPRYFYPYGPLISEHFFKKRKNVRPVAEYMIDDDTYVIHWGASSKFLNEFGKQDILKRATESVFTYLESEVIKANSASEA